MSSENSAKITLVDCDNFYASCERIFQPRFRDRPVIVLSNNDGCVVARSLEAKALGIGMGVPYYQVKEIVRQRRVAVFSSNYTLYGDMSRRVMETLAGLAKHIEVYSIDEAFLEPPDSADKNYGLAIRETILKNTGIPVTVGIGETRTLAKVAAEYAKKNLSERVCDLTADTDREAILASILAQDVWGIGPRIAEWLYQRNINTALDLCGIDDTLMRRRAGITGLRVVHELRGIPCVELRPLWKPRKGITSSRSFGEYVTALDYLEESVATHATRAAEKLRQDGSVAGQLAVFITTNVHANHPQYANTAYVPSIPPSNADSDLVRLAILGIRRIYRSGFKYIKAGVTLTNITPAAQRQLDIFARPDIDRQDRLYRAVDHLNRRYGSGTIHPVACGIKQQWAMRRDFRSPRYTTCWYELPVARL